MKKTALLVLLSTVLFSALAADDYFLGTGTSTQNKVPTYGYNNYGWSKFIYTGDELAAAGVTAPSASPAWLFRCQVPSATT